MSVVIRVVGCDGGGGGASEGGASVCGGVASGVGGHSVNINTGGGSGGA